jgi:hypothetical protein
MNEEKSDLSPVKETPFGNNETKGNLNESCDNFSYAQGQNLIVSNFVLNEVISERDEESKQEYTGDLNSVIEEKEPFRIDPEISKVQMVPHSPEASMRANEDILEIVPEENPLNEPSDLHFRTETSQDEIPEPQESAEERLRVEQAERERREREAIEHAGRKAMDLKQAEIEALRELQGEMETIEGKANDILSRYNS